MPVDEITDEVTIGSTPGSPNGQVPETAGRVIKVGAVATREYVAGSPLSYYTNLPKVLPFAIDDLTSELGHDLYSKMMFDAQVRSTVSVFKAGILEEGITLTPAIDDADEDGYEQAKDLYDRAQRMLEEIDIDAALWDMADAVAFGHRIAEQVYDLDSTITGKQEYVLRTLAVRPPESVAFVVDVYLNVLGILGRIPGEPFGVQQGALLADIEHTANLLPRSKFAVLTFRPVNNSPLGSSCLRAAYDPWNVKQQLKKEFLKYLAQFATPSLVGTTAEGAQAYQLLNADGTGMEDQYGNPVMRTPEEDQITAMEAFKNGSAISQPYGATVTPIEMTGDGAPFLKAFDFLDRQITKAVLNQTLATEEGQHQTRAASGTHKDILDTITRQAKRPVERMVRRDILGTWLMLNGQEKLAQLLPNVTLGTLENEDLGAQRLAVAALYKAGYLDSSQLPGVDSELKLPERVIAPEPPVQPVAQPPGQVPADPTQPQTAPNQPPAQPQEQPLDPAEPVSV
jgi:hypothetical protein